MIKIKKFILKCLCEYGVFGCFAIILFSPLYPFVILFALLSYFNEFVSDWAEKKLNS